MAGSSASVAPPALATDTRLFGLVILEQRRVIERILGPEGYRRALDRLPADRRAEYVNVGMFSWCRTTTVALLLTEAAPEANQLPNDFTARVVREGFGSVMRTVWRLFMSFSTDEAIVRRAATVYTKAIDRGKAKAFVEAPGHLVLEISEWPDIHAIDIVAIAAGIEAALEVAGRKAQIVHRRSPGNVIRFDVRAAVRAEKP